MKSICWKCKNFSKCSWSKGVPVENWQAIPTRVIGKNNITVRSFIVQSCPNFREDDVFEVSMQEVAEMIGLNCRSDIGLYTASLKRVNTELKKLGYELFKKEKWCLRRLDANKE